MNYEDDISGFLDNDVYDKYFALFTRYKSRIAECFKINLNDKNQEELTVLENKDLQIKQQLATSNISNADEEILRTLMNEYITLLSPGKFFL